MASVWNRKAVGPGWARTGPVPLETWILPELSKRHLATSKGADRGRPGGWAHRCWDWYEGSNLQKYWLWLVHLVVRQLSPLGSLGIKWQTEQPDIPRFWARHGQVFLSAKRQLGCQDSSAEFWTLFTYKNLWQFCDCQLQLESTRKEANVESFYKGKLVAQGKGVKSTQSWSLEEPRSILWKCIWLPTMRW